jgi:hypothetical protein
MRLLILSFIFISLLSNDLIAQEKKPSFLEKKNQGSFEFEPFLSFSLSYAYKFNPKLTLGARAQLGFGARLLLTNPSVDYKGDQYDGIHTFHQEVRAFTNGLFTDMLKFQCFYRFSNVKHLYIDVGPYASFGMVNEMEGGKSAGLEASVFYTRKHFHIGTRILAGWQTFDFSDDIVFALFSIPLVVGINF